MECGWAAVFDPYVAILDTNRFELAVSDDTALALQDPIASIVAPADGKYIIQVRETSYGGDGENQYLLHVGTYPRPWRFIRWGAMSAKI